MRILVLILGITILFGCDQNPVGTEKVAEEPASKVDPIDALRKERIQKHFVYRRQNRDDHADQLWWDAVMNNLMRNHGLGSNVYRGNKIYAAGDVDAERWRSEEFLQANPKHKGTKNFAMILCHVYLNLDETKTPFEEDGKKGYVCTYAIISALDNTVAYITRPISRMGELRTLAVADRIDAYVDIFEPPIMEEVAALSPPDDKQQSGYVIRVGG